MSSNLYLRPLGLRSGADAGELLESGLGARLSGGRLAFDTCEVLWRDGNHTRSAVAPLHQIRDWAARTGGEIGERADGLVERLTSPDRDRAGLSFECPLVMGVLNVTPDSFYDGGHHDGITNAVARGQVLGEEGADIIDVGGESTRPGAEPVDVDVEVARVRPVIASLSDAGVPLSVDTRKAPVMAAAVRAGAALINDVSALTFDPHGMGMAARTSTPVVLMHSLGDPSTMQDDPHYGNVVLDVYDYLEARIAACEAAGIPRHRIIVDPGIGFGKTHEHNLALIRGLGTFHGLGCPLLLGVSRKSTIGRLSGGVEAGGVEVEERLPGSLAVGLWGLSQGVQMLRVHDVRETRLAVDAWFALAGGGHS